MEIAKPTLDGPIKELIEIRAIRTPALSNWLALDMGNVPNIPDFVHASSRNLLQ